MAGAVYKVPVEIWMMIVRYVMRNDPSPQSLDLLDMIRTCKLFWRTFAPILYKTVSAEYNLRRRQDYLPYVDPRYRSFEPLIHTLSTSPLTASFVHEAQLKLMVDLWDWDRYGDREDEREYEEYRDAFLNVTVSTSMSRLLKHFAGPDSALMSLDLSSDLFGQYLTKYLLAAGPFTSLKKLKLDCVGSLSVKELGQICKFVAKPSLESLSLHVSVSDHTSDSDDRTLQSPFRTACSNLKRLPSSSPHLTSFNLHLSFDSSLKRDTQHRPRPGFAAVVKTLNALRFPEIRQLHAVLWGREDEREPARRSKKLKPVPRHQHDEYTASLVSNMLQPLHDAHKELRGEGEVSFRCERNQDDNAAWDDDACPRSF